MTFGKECLSPLLQKNEIKPSRLFRVILTTNLKVLLHENCQRHDDCHHGIYSIEKIKMVSKSLAVVICYRVQFVEGADNARYHQVHVFLLDEETGKLYKDDKEWQYVDAYSYYNDCPELAVRDIGEVKIDPDSEKGRPSIMVELLNNDFPPRERLFCLHPV